MVPVHACSNLSFNGRTITIRTGSWTTRKRISTGTSRCTLTSLTKRHLRNSSHLYNPLQDYSSSQSEKTILIVGDGDLSFGAFMSEQLKLRQQFRSDADADADADANAECKIKMIASVLESEHQHNQVYGDSLKNIERIQKNGHEVRFEVDATRLSEHFSSNNHGNHCGDNVGIIPDRIQFNFPHWRGKANNRRNRNLLNDFIKSSREILPCGGQIHVSLLKHQAGMHAKNTVEWKRSWFPGMFAGEHGMLLSHVLPFEPEYNLSSYQFRDRGFHLNHEGREPFMHILTKTNMEMGGNGDGDGDGDGDSETEICFDNDSANTTIKASREFQMCSYFSLFLAFPIPLGKTNNIVDDIDNSQSSERVRVLWTNGEISDEKFIHKIIESKTPPGIRTEIRPWRILREKPAQGQRDKHSKWKVAEYRVVFFGESQPISFQDAECYKKAIEDEVELFTKGTRRGGWTSSKVVPSSILRERGWCY